ncbi:MAG: arsenite methyltransferase [Acidobacteria bacterium]|nr:arsenite methyltransferase [Acidobacteriota bacterium]
MSQAVPGGEAKDQEVKGRIRERYGAIARSVGAGRCGTTACGCGDPISSNLYSGEQTDGVPADAVAASLGCGNPTSLLALEPGETVLDLGSGAGLDVLLSARRVGPTGKAYGLDMTGEMLALARENQRKAGAGNVEFLEGTIEAIPLPDRAVDAIISNCVINLSTDKDAVLREAFRVLKPGGRLGVSDVVTRGAGDVPAEIRRSMELWIGCIAGALSEDEYRDKLRAAGFTDIEVEPWRIYRLEDARAYLGEAGLDVDRLGSAADGRFASAFVRARKPMAAARPCCGSDCCAASSVPADS